MTRKRRGQALVESALIALVFLAMLIGIFDMAQALFIHQTMLERTRNAVRRGVVAAYDPVTIRNFVLYNQAAAPEGATSGFMGLTEAMVNVARAGAGTNDDRVTVTISNYPFRFFSPLIAGRFYGRPISVTLPVEAL